MTQEELTKKIEASIKLITMKDLEIWLYKNCEGRYLDDVLETIHKFVEQELPEVNND